MGARAIITGAQLPSKPETKTSRTIFFIWQDKKSKTGDKTNNVPGLTSVLGSSFLPGAATHFFFPYPFKILSGICAKPAVQHLSNYGIVKEGHLLYKAATELCQLFSFKGRML